MSLLAVALFVVAAVDPGSARAIAARNNHLLDDSAAALADAHAALALERLLSVNEDDRRLDRRRFLTLRGRARLALGIVDAGAADLDEVRRAALPAVDRALNVLLASAWRDLGRFDDCADVLAGSGDLDDDGAVLRASCLRGTTRRGAAHDALVGHDGAAARELRARLLLEDGLPRAARVDVAALVDVVDDDGVAAFAAGFRAAGDVAFARVLDDVVAARRGRAPAPSATRAALSLDERARLRVRLAGLVAAQHWEELAALQQRARAAGYLDDDDVRYAVAWALFVTGDLDGADRALDGVVTPTGFRKASELRAALLACRASEDRCPG